MNLRLTLARWITSLAILGIGVGAAAQQDNPAHVGSWMVVSKSALGEIRSVLVFDSPQEGWYGLPNSKVPIRNLVVTEGDVQFAVTVYVEAAGQDVPLNFRASFSGDAFEGGFFLPGSDTRMAELTGTRAPNEKELADFVARATAERKVAAEKAAMIGEPGDYAVTVSIKKFNGDSVAGKPFKLWHLEKGEPVSVRDGTVPSSGVVKFTRLVGGEKADAWYVLAVDEETISIYSPSNSFHLDGADKDRRVDIVLACVVGDRAPNVTVVDVVTGDHVELDSYRGKVVFLDFWASWCQPCQEPMARNDEIMGRRNDWDGKAAILAISIDETPEEARKHMTRKGWDHVTNLWVPAEAGSAILRDSEVARAFGLVGIPDTILIDQNGIIRARGRDLDPEPLIDGLLGK